jgi:hypothetical protein
MKDLPIPEHVTARMDQSNKHPKTEGQALAWMCVLQYLAFYDLANDVGLPALQQPKKFRELGARYMEVLRKETCRRFPQFETLKVATWQIPKDIERPEHFGFEFLEKGNEAHRKIAEAAAEDFGQALAEHYFNLDLNPGSMTIVWGTANNTVTPRDAPAA